MLKFFRTIRKKLIEQDNIRKYLLYAIGEIALVMIGILLALQVNNWNEERLDKIKTQNYLLEMSGNLESDLIRLDEVTTFNEKQDSLLTAGIRILVGGHSDSEIVSFLAENAYDLSEFYTFDFKSVAFENLTSTGDIDLLQDLELRNNLTEYYQWQYGMRMGTQSRVAQIVRAYSDLATPLILNRETVRTIMNEENVFPEEINLSMEQKARLAALLYTIRYNMRNQSDQIDEVRTTALALLDQLRNNLPL